MDKQNENKEDVIEINETSATEEVKKATSWWEKNVTRKFLSIALALALVLNIALTAGAVKLLGHKKGFDKGTLGRPGNEQRFDGNHGGRGNMMPPSGNQPPNGQQSQQPDDQKNQQSDDQQDESQQSEDQKSSSQKTA